MRSGSRYLLMAVVTLGTNVQAQETNGSLGTQPMHSSGQVVDLQQRLTESERQREELLRQMRDSGAERDSAQLTRLRQENQRLKLQLKEAQAVAPQRLLSDDQQWFVAGGGVAMIALLCGIFASGWRRRRRQWLN